MSEYSTLLVFTDSDIESDYPWTTAEDISSKLGEPFRLVHVMADGHYELQVQHD